MKFCIWQSRRRLFQRLKQEEQRLKKHNGRSMDIQQSPLVREPFFKKASNLWKTAYSPSAIILIIYSPFANY